MADKLARARERMIEKAREYQIGTYAHRFVASVFQLLVRAEAAALPAAEVPAMVDGQYTIVPRQVGQCVCVTCGTVGPWKGTFVYGGAVDTGHFIASRRASILFEESNVHPQCKYCNRHLGGNPGMYAIWMRHAYGQEEIDRLQRLKNEIRQFTREELVDMKIGYAARLKAAEALMKGVS